MGISGKFRGKQERCWVTYCVCWVAMKMNLKAQKRSQKDKTVDRVLVLHVAEGSHSWNPSGPASPLRVIPDIRAMSNA